LLPKYPSEQLEGEEESEGEEAEEEEEKEEEYGGGIFKK
jgi:hypothetical protein